MRLRDVASLRQQQGHRVFGRRDDVALRCVDHHHATASGLGYVDVVETDAGPPDDHQIAAGL